MVSPEDQKRTRIGMPGMISIHGLPLGAHNLQIAGAIDTNLKLLKKSLQRPSRWSSDPKSLKLVPHDLSRVTILHLTFSISQTASSSRVGLPSHRGDISMLSI